MEKFLKAQQSKFDAALAEIRGGRKRTHWMWYIFPQVKGLGHSYMSKLYAIDSLEQAHEFLYHPVLGERLREITGALLFLENTDAHAIFGSPDDMKLRSSMTLFDAVEPNSIFSKVLDKFYGGKKDTRTLKILGLAAEVPDNSYENREEDNDKHLSRPYVLLGSICGDIIGSAHEHKRTKRLDFPLFSPASKITDDTVCSIAVADALIHNNEFLNKMIYWCRKYPYAGYGGKFRHWFIDDDPKPYQSYGNGSAMRVSAVGAYAKSIDEVLILARQSAEISHNHPCGIIGAQAVALAIYLSLNGESKESIKKEISLRFNYNLDRRYFEIQPGYGFDSTCQGSVPEAIIAFLESYDYESAVRLAVALGGDADTQAAIAGGIAAAYYGSIPDTILKGALGRLPDEMKSVIKKFNKVLVERTSTSYNS